MSKGQRGNKEAKKPKKVPAAVRPETPVDAVPATGQALRDRPKKK